MMIQDSLGYGSFVVIPVEVFPAGAIFETKIPAVKNLSAGGGIGSRTCWVQYGMGNCYNLSRNY